MTTGAPDAQSSPTAISAPRGSNRMHSAFEAHGDALGFENLLDRGRYVLVLARDQPRRLLHDGHRGAEAAVHLRELEADIAAADHDQMFAAACRARESTCWSRWRRDRFQAGPERARGRPH